MPQNAVKLQARVLSRVFGTESNGITRWQRKMHTEEL
jgi:hypothetical protein